MAISSPAIAAEPAAPPRLAALSGGLGRLPLWGGLLVCAAVFAYSWYGDHYQYVGDDGGITLRYAERFAQGKGLNYNDGEAVNGASNPLVILTEAACFRLGLGPDTTVLLIASACLAATAGVLFATFARFYSVGAALFSTLALLAFNEPFEKVVDGMETPLVILLAALLFRALHERRAVFPGIVLGLLVAGKLDGALAAVAFTAVYLLAKRSFPWRTALIALVTAAPMFVLLFAYFGSLLPNSMTTKLAIHSQNWDMDPLWMHRLLTIRPFRVLYWGAWASLLWWPLARDLGRSFPVTVIQIWFVLHMVTFATVNLGAPFPWYATAPLIHSVILSTFVVHALSSAVVARTGRWRLEWLPDFAPRRAWPVGLALVGGLGALGWSNLAGRLQPSTLAHRLAPSTATDLGRQAAGAWLRVHTSGTELLATFEGLPSFEYGGPCYDFALLNSKSEPRRYKSAAYLLAAPIRAGLDAPFENAGRELVATFQFDASKERYPLYARPGTEIVQSGARHIVFTTPTMWLGPEDDPGATSLPSKGNAWNLPANASARFAVTSPGPPTCLFTPRVTYAERRSPDPGDSVHLTVRSQGVELYSADVGGDRATPPARVTAPSKTADGRYEFEVECRYTGDGQAGNARLKFSEVLVRYGEPLRSKDFKLGTRRCRARVDYVADTGMPNTQFGY
jgi:hypothetical protein